MKWGTLGTIGGLCLAGYLILVGIIAIAGSSGAIPAWAIGSLAVVAGGLILVGR